jgi:hypothetical protein
VQILLSALCGGGRFCLLSYLVNAAKKKSTTSLLTERVLVLALTLLLNVEHGNLAPNVERPALMCLHRIEEDKVRTHTHTFNMNVILMIIIMIHVTVICP